MLRKHIDCRETATDASISIKEMENLKNLKCYKKIKLKIFKVVNYILTKLVSGLEYQLKLPVKQMLKEDKLNEIFDDSDKEQILRAN